MSNFRSFNGGRIQQYGVMGGSEGPVTLPSSLESGNATGPQTTNKFWRGGVLTYEKPIVEFFGDVILAGGVGGTITAFLPGQNLPNNCVGVRFIALAGGVTAVINGGGLRTILNNDVFSGCEIRSMTVYCAAAAAVTVQAVGTGD